MQAFYILLTKNIVFLAALNNIEVVIVFCSKFKMRINMRVYIQNVSFGFVKPSDDINNHNWLKYLQCKKDKGKRRK